MTLAETAFMVAAELRAAKRGALASQLERAGASIPANIAEGHGRYRATEFLHFLVVSFGSLREAETFVELGSRLGAAKKATATVFFQQADELARVLWGLKKSIEERKAAS